MNRPYLRSDALRAVSHALDEAMPGWHIYLEEIENMTFPAIQITLVTVEARTGLHTRRADDYTVQIAAMRDDYANKDYADDAQRIQAALERFEYKGERYRASSLSWDVRDRTLYMMARISALYRRVETPDPVMQTLEERIMDNSRNP